MPALSWLAVSVQEPFAALRVMTQSLAEPALMVTLPAGVPVNLGATCTDSFSLCSLPALTLAADSISVVAVGSAATVSAAGAEVEDWNVELPA